MILKLIPLYSLARHSIDDAVSTRIHVPNSPGNPEEGESESDHQPQDDVEDHWVHICVRRCEVQCLEVKEKQILRKYNRESRQGTKQDPYGLRNVSTNLRVQAERYTTSLTCADHALFNSIPCIKLFGLPCVAVRLTMCSCSAYHV